MIFLTRDQNRYKRLIHRHLQDNEKKQCFKKTHGVVLVYVLKMTVHAISLLKSFK